MTYLVPTSPGVYKHVLSIYIADEIVQVQSLGAYCKSLWGKWKFSWKPFKASRIVDIFQCSFEDYSINHDIGI